MLLYAHYDVQPPLDEHAWRTPPFQLTEVDGRWYGRGAADCKGNILMHLVALRALGDQVPVNLKLIVEGSEEQGTGGLEDYVPKHADLLRADAILVCDTGNAEVGEPAVTVSLRGLANVVVSVEALSSEVHSGMYGGPAPDALAALIHLLATLRDDAGNTTITGLDNTQTWDGVAWPPEQFRTDAQLLDGVSLLGDGTVSDMVWARPAVTVLGIDCPPVIGSAAAIQPHARARLNLRVPPGMDPVEAQDALVAHLEAAAPWGVRVTVERESSGEPFQAHTGGPAYGAAGRGDAGGLRQADDHPGPGRLDPAVQRLRRHLPRRRDHPHGGGGAADPDARPQRERPPRRDRQHGLDRGAVPPPLRHHPLTTSRRPRPLSPADQRAGRITLDG